MRPPDARVRFLPTRVAGVLSDDEGATLAEYGILVLLIAVASVTLLAAFGPQVAGLFGPVVPAL